MRFDVLKQAIYAWLQPPGLILYFRPPAVEASIVAVAVAAYYLRYIIADLLAKMEQVKARLIMAPLLPI